jgi:hypothetical protein
MKSITTLGALGALLVVTGCGASALPPAKVTETQSAISAAEAVGAENQPRGALHLKLARDQMKQAEALLREGDEEEARLVLERARIDAELALTLTRENKAQADAQQAVQQITTLERKE